MDGWLLTTAPSSVVALRPWSMVRRIKTDQGIASALSLSGRLGASETRGIRGSLALAFPHEATMCLVYAWNRRQPSQWKRASGVTVKGHAVTHTLVTLHGLR